MNKNHKSNLDAKGLFLALSDVMTNDEEFVNELLREEGRNPKDLEDKGRQFFHKHFLKQRLANQSNQKTTLLNQITQRVVNFLQEQSATVSSNLLPGQSGSQQQLFTMLCNKFKEFSPEDLQGIMQDEAVLKELQKIQPPKP